MRTRLSLYFAFACAFFFIGCHEIEPEVSFNKEEYSVGSEGGEFIISFSSNVGLTASVSESWITEIPSKNTSNSFCFKADFNPDYDDRTCYISFANLEAGYSDKVKVTQRQQDAIIPANTQYGLDYKEQSFTLPVSSNISDFTVSTTEDWISFISTRGLTGRDLQFSIKRNNSKASREAIINITSGDLHQSIRVHQLAIARQPSTSEEFQESLAMLRSIEDRIKKGIGDLSEQPLSDTTIILETIKGFDEVVDAAYNDDYSALTIIQRDGIVIDYLLKSKFLTLPIDPIQTEPLSNTDKNNSRRNTAGAVTNNKSRALILAGVNDLAQFGANLDSIRNALCLSFGADNVKVLNGPTMPDKNGEYADFTKFKGEYLDDYDFIFIATHGQCVPDVNVELPDETFLPFDDLWYDIVKTAGHKVTALATGTRYDENFHKDYIATKKVKAKDIRLMCIDVFSDIDREWHQEYRVSMTPSYLEDAAFDNTFVMMGSCYSAKIKKGEYSLIDSFINKGAAFCTGYNDTMSAEMSFMIVFRIVNAMVHGLSFQDAKDLVLNSKELNGYQSSIRGKLRKYYENKVAKGETPEESLEELQSHADRNLFYPRVSESITGPVFLTDPRPTLKDPTFDGSKVELSWDCNLMPYTEEWLQYQYPGNEFSQYKSFRVSYEVYIDGTKLADSIFGDKTRKSATWIPKEAKDYRWYVVANMKEGDTIVASYKSDEKRFTVGAVSEYIELTTSAAQSVTNCSASIGVKIESNWTPNIVERGVVYSSVNSTPTVGYTDSKTQKSNTTSSSFTVQLNSLTPGTKYYARAFVTVEDKNACTNYYGNTIEFTTESAPAGVLNIGVDPTSIKFKDFTIGNTDQGDSFTEILTVMNTGDVPIAKVGAVLEDYEGPFTLDYPAGITLNPGQKMAIEVTFAPQKEGTYTNTVYVRYRGSNDQDGPEIPVPVSGKALTGQSSGGYNSEVIDLGLSVKWATCNLGATKPEEFGEYYAWGETDTKESYTWSTYKWCKGTDNTITKYCWEKEKGYNGFTDNKSQLEISDDAAHDKLKGDFRIPTTVEWRELMEKCSWTWTSNYQGTGVSGYIVKSKISGYTNRSIFLPAAGYQWNKNIGVGNYMTSSAINSSSTGYDAVYFSKDECIGANYQRGCSCTSREEGTTIRPVQGAEVSPRLTFSPSSISFADVPVGEKTWKQVYIKNNSNVDIIVTGVSLQDGSTGFSISGGEFDNGRIHVLSGDTVDYVAYTIEYNPTSAQRTTDKLLIKSTGGDYSVSISGTAVESGPKIEYSRDEINYGTVNVNAAVTTGIIITNTGNETLILTKVKMVEGDQCFSMPFESTYQGKEIEPGSTATITVRFNPTKAGEFADQILIKSNATNYSYNLIYLYGKAK